MGASHKQVNDLSGSAAVDEPVAPPAGRHNSRTDQPECSSMAVEHRSILMGAAGSAFHKCAHMPMSRHWGQRRLKRMSDIRRPVGSQDVGGPSARSLRK